MPTIAAYCGNLRVCANGWRPRITAYINMIHISNPNGLISSANIDVSHRGRKRRKRGSAIGSVGITTSGATSAAKAVGSGSPGSVSGNNVNNSGSDEDDVDEDDGDGEGEYDADDEEVDDEDELATTNDGDSDRLHDMSKLHIPFWDKYDAVNQLYLDMGK